MQEMFPILKTISGVGVSVQPCTQPALGEKKVFISSLLEELHPASNRLPVQANKWAESSVPSPSCEDTPPAAVHLDKVRTNYGGEAENHSYSSICKIIYSICF